MKQLFSLVLLLTACAGSYAQNQYDATLIPDALKARANATIREENTVVDMQSPNEVNYSVKKAITILNKNGDENARLVLFYDKNTSIKAIKGEVYNEFGKLVGKFTGSNFKDESAVSGFSLFEDSRLKHYLPAVTVYPYTVVYQYELRFKQNLIIPDWTPKPAADVAVETSSYSFICKPSDHFRIKTQRYNGKVEEFADEKQKKMVWMVNNVPANKVEPYSPNAQDYVTKIKIAPQQFSYYNYKGTYATWEELGKWSYDNLLKGRNQLLPASVLDIQELVKGATTDKEKAQKIYKYMQDKTRYVSVQIGIGGYQPIIASEVDRLGYGDCKGLVNYLQAMLNVVGIESYYCIANAGKEKISLDPTYASMNQANHVILCLPLKGDTTWLECTSKTNPFGYLGDFTDDRYVLACTPTGGKLLRTPKFEDEKSVQSRQASLQLTVDGNVSGTTKTVFSGVQYDNNEHIIEKSSIEQTKLLKDVYDINNIDFEKIKYLVNKNENPTITETFDVDIRSYGSVSGNVLSLQPNIFSVQTVIPEVKNRTMPVFINRGFLDIDTMSYQLPKNAILVSKPTDKQLSNEFGTYHITTQLKGDQLIYIRRLKINSGTFPADRYAIFCQFMADVRSNDHLKLAFNLIK
jgi:transglutaminase-like putative cysteine protease